MIRYVLRRGGHAGCAAVAVAVSLLVASCGGSHSADAYAVPSKITPAYVQRVLNALEGVEARAADLIVAAKRITPSAEALIGAVTTAGEKQRELTEWRDQLSNDLGDVRNDPGAVDDHISSLVSSNESCIFVATRRDFSKVTVTTVQPHTTYFVLRTEARPSANNPTPWQIDVVGYNSKGLAPADPCQSS